jgi:hypothetical protein
MSLTRRSGTDASARPDDYLLMHGRLPVGRICRRHSAFRADANWLWTLNGVIGGPDTLCRAGTSASPETAEAQVNENWSRWLQWAKLSETKRA